MQPHLPSNPYGDMGSMSGGRDASYSSLGGGLPAGRALPHYYSRNIGDTPIEDHHNSAMEHAVAMSSVPLYATDGGGDERYYARYLRAPLPSAGGHYNNGYPRPMYAPGHYGYTYPMHPTEYNPYGRAISGGYDFVPSVYPPAASFHGGGDPPLPSGISISRANYSAPMHGHMAMGPHSQHSLDVGGEEMYWMGRSVGAPPESADSAWPAASRSSSRSLHQAVHETTPRTSGDIIPSSAPKGTSTTYFSNAVVQFEDSLNMVGRTYASLLPPVVALASASTSRLAFGPRNVDYDAAPFNLTLQQLPAPRVTGSASFATFTPPMNAAAVVIASACAPLARFRMPYGRIADVRHVKTRHKPSKMNPPRQYHPATLNSNAVPGGDPLYLVHEFLVEWVEPVVVLVSPQACLLPSSDGGSTMVTTFGVHSEHHVCTDESTEELRTLAAELARVLHPSVKNARAQLEQLADVPIHIVKSWVPEFDIEHDVQFKAFCRTNAISVGTEPSDRKQDDAMKKCAQRYGYSFPLQFLQADGKHVKATGLIAPAGMARADGTRGPGLPESHHGSRVSSVSGSRQPTPKRKWSDTSPGGANGAGGARKDGDLDVHLDPRLYRDEGETPKTMPLPDGEASAPSSPHDDYNSARYGGMDTMDLARPGTWAAYDALTGDAGEYGAAYPTFVETAPRRAVTAVSRASGAMMQAMMANRPPYEPQPIRLGAPGMPPPPPGYAGYSALMPQDVLVPVPAHPNEALSAYSRGIMNERMMAERHAHDPHMYLTVRAAEDLFQQRPSSKHARSSHAATMDGPPEAKRARTDRDGGASAPKPPALKPSTVPTATLVMPPETDGQGVLYGDSGE